MSYEIIEPNQIKLGDRIYLDNDIDDDTNEWEVFKTKYIYKNDICHYYFLVRTKIKDKLKNKLIEITDFNVVVRIDKDKNEKTTIKYL